MNLNIATTKRKIFPMEPKLLEQDLSPALRTLEFQMNSAHDMIKFWTVYKARSQSCPEIEKVSGMWWNGLF